MRGRFLHRVTRLVFCSFLAMHLASCFSERAETTGPVGGDECGVPTSALGSKKAVVTLYRYNFYPDTLRISAGTKVTWVNCDVSAGADAHTSTSDSGVWSSPAFAEGFTFGRDFNQGGVFPYHCVPHPSMRAVIIVQ
jgi:plastocyanin